MGRRLTDRREKKPGYRSSGFFVLLFIAVATGMADGQPSALAGGMFGDTAASGATVPAVRPDTTRPFNRVFIDGVFHDLYRRITTEGDGSGTEIDRTEVFSPQASAGIIIGRKTWGASAWVRTGMIEAHGNGRDRDYAVDASSPLAGVAMAGWAAAEGRRFFRGVLSGLRVSVFAGLGYDQGLPLDYRGFSNASLIHNPLTVFRDPRCAHCIGGSFQLKDLSCTLYESRRPLLEASARVERVSNGAFVEVPLAAVMQEAGGKADVSMGRNHSVFTCAYMTMSSDTALAGDHVLPAGISGKGLRSGFRISLADVRCAPAAEFTSWTQRVKIRGYDYSDTVPYCWLDSTAAFFVSGRASADAPWKLRAGVFAECLNAGTRNFGRFDPYVFSGFTFFDPKKYRVDTIGISYSAVGLFLERRSSVFRRDSAGATLAASYVRSSGKADTREYDFSYVWPRLINPRTFLLLDEELFLFVPEVRYTYLAGRFACTASLRQILAVSLRGGGGGGEPSSAATSVRGGTTIRVRAEYAW